MTWDVGLRVSECTAQQRREAIATSLSLGYQGISVDTTIPAPFTWKQIPEPKDVSLPQESILSASAEAREQSSLLQSLVSQGPAFQQLSRLTVYSSSPQDDDSAEAILVSLKSAAQTGSLTPFHIVAARPSSQKALAKLCTSSQIDLISIDIGKKLPFKLRFPLVTAAIQQGIFFELVYSPLLDPSVLRQAMVNGQMIAEVTKGKNIILSSGSSTASCLRAPMDAANLASSLFRLNRNAAWKALTSNCRALFESGRKRRLLYKGAVWLDSIVLTESTRAPNRSTDVDMSSASNAREDPKQRRTSADVVAKTTLGDRSRNVGAEPSSASATPPSLRASLNFPSCKKVSVMGTGNLVDTVQPDFLPMDFDYGWETVSKKPNAEQRKPKNQKGKRKK